MNNAPAEFFSGLFASGQGRGVVHLFQLLYRALLYPRHVGARYPELFRCLVLRVRSSAVQPVAVDDELRLALVKTARKKAVQLLRAYRQLHLLVYVHAVVDDVDEVAVVTDDAQFARRDFCVVEHETVDAQFMDFTGDRCRDIAGTGRSDNRMGSR